MREALFALAYMEEMIMHGKEDEQSHFIDVLETCDCVIWGDGAWNLTDLGRAMLAELKSAKEA